jgi:hypothetical protein
MNTLGSLRYAVRCKKCTCFGVLFLFCSFSEFPFFVGLPNSLPVHSFSSASFCCVSSSFCGASLWTCLHHGPSSPFRCVPFSVMFKIFFGAISSFVCLFIQSFFLCSLFLFIFQRACVIVFCYLSPYHPSICFLFWFFLSWFFIPYFLKISVLCYTCNVIQLLISVSWCLTMEQEDLKTPNFVKNVFMKCRFQ